MVSKHICKPEKVPIFDCFTYQCSCGRYFSKERMNQIDSNFILPIKSVKQLPTHCGPACVEMTLKFYGIKNIDQLKIGKDMNVAWRDGCFPFQIIRYLKRFKIICRKDRSRKRVLEYFIKSRQPIILGEATHFTLLIGKENDKYIIIDPYSGKQKIKNYDYFQQVNEYIIIIEANEVNYEKEISKN